MNRRNLWFVIPILLAITCSGKGRTPPVYNEKADAHHDITAAIANAEESNRNIVLIFGANWCPDCRALHWQMQQPGLAPIIKKNFVVVQVDLGRENKNMDLADHYHVPIKHGIPALAILDSHGSLLYAMDQGQFADARRMSAGSIKAFFVKWVPSH